MKTPRFFLMGIVLLVLWFMGCHPTQRVKTYDINGMQVTYIQSRPLHGDFVDSIFIEKSGVTVEYGDCRPFGSLDYVIETGKDRKNYKLVGYHDQYIATQESYYKYLKKQIETIEDQRWYDHVRKYYSR